MMATTRPARTPSPKNKTVKTRGKSADGASADMRQVSRSCSGQPPESARWSERVRGLRMRQASVAAILDETFGRFAESDPSLWDRQTYLMLVGIAYERLAVDEENVSTDELIALAKLLAESRRADTQARDRAPGQESPDSNSTPADEPPPGTQRSTRGRSRGDRPMSGQSRADRAEGGPTDNGRLPDAFGDVVRQIYGTMLPAPKSKASE